MHQVLKYCMQAIQQKVNCGQKHNIQLLEQQGGCLIQFCLFTVYFTLLQVKKQYHSMRQISFLDTCA